MIPLIFPKVPQSSLGILRVLQLPPPLGHPGTTHPLRTLTDLRNDKDLGVSVIDGQSFLLVTRISDGAISILDQTGSKGKLIIFSMCQTGKRSRNTICICIYIDVDSKKNIIYIIIHVYLKCIFCICM